jgi:hypothetical protein
MINMQLSLRGNALDPSMQLPRPSDSVVYHKRLVKEKLQICRALLSSDAAHHSRVSMPVGLFSDLQPVCLLGIWYLSGEHALTFGIKEKI